MAAVCAVDCLVGGSAARGEGIGEVGDGDGLGCVEGVWGWGLGDARDDGCGGIGSGEVGVDSGGVRVGVSVDVGVDVDA